MVTIGVAGCTDAASHTLPALNPSPAAVGQLRIGGAYMTARLRVLLVPIDESTTDPEADCWVVYGIDARRVRPGVLAVSMRVVEQAAPSGGTSCTAQAVAVYQKVRLPVRYRGQRLLGGTGHRIVVTPEPAGLKAPVVGVRR